MFASDVVNIVGPGEEISDKDTGRASRAIGCGDGSLAGAGGGTANHDAAGRRSGDKRKLGGDGHSWECSQLDMTAAKPGGRGVEKSREEDMRFLEAEQLGTQRERSEKVRVRRRYIVFPVLNQVIRREGILRGKVIVQTGQTEIFPDLLDRVGESCLHTSCQDRTIRRLP